MIEEYLNKIICGDCRDVIKDIPDDYVDLIIADPPYLTTKETWDKEEVVNKELVKQFYRVLKETGNLYVWCGIGEKSQSLIRWFPIFSDYFCFKDLITWKKQRGNGMRKGWLYTREEVMWFVKDNKKFIWNKEEQYSKEKRAYDIFLKDIGSVHKSEYKRLTNVWIDINEVGYGTCPSKYKHLRNKEIATPKPIEAIERIIRLHTKEKDIVIDPFLGSGQTAIVCKKLNRNFIGIDISKKYCKLAKERVARV